MSVWAVVPVKPLGQGKSRLRDVLTSSERRDMGREMMLRTLVVLASTPGIARTLVVSQDAEVLALAEREGAQAVPEGRVLHLNRALKRATRVATQSGASAVLVLPADLPLLEREQVERLLVLAGDRPVVVIAPDRKRQGTNALLCSPPGLIEYAFGRDSYAHHQARVRRAGARLEICVLPELELDLDSPEDLELLGRSPRAWRQPHRPWPG